MKQVVKQLETVTPETVSVEKYYGVESRGFYRGFIAAKEYDKSPCTVYASSHVTKCNGWETFHRPTLKETVSALLENQNFKAFEFNTHQELFRWLSESKEGE